jgi:hypothetical protein
LDLADAKEGAARSRRLRLAANATKALQGEARPPKPRRLKEREAGIVWWQDYTARFRALPPEEARATKGVAFSVLCEMVATFAGTDGAELRAASYLKGWVDTGMLTNCRIG